MKKIVKNVVILSVVALIAYGSITGVIPWGRILGISKTVAGNVAHSAGVNAGNLSVGGSGPVGGTAGANACRENLSRIHSAKLSIRSKTGLEVKDVSWDAVIKEMGGRGMPKCPSGGSYSLGTMQELPRCSIAANGTADGTDDHLIKK